MTGPREGDMTDEGECVGVLRTDQRKQTYM